MLKTFRWTLQKILLNWFQQFFWTLDILLKLFLWTRNVQFWQPGSDFIPIYGFFSINIWKNSKKRKIFFLFKLRLWIIAQTGRRMLVILKHFSKILEANEMKRFVFKKHACILLKSIFNTVAICSFVCWVPCNLFSLDLQLLSDILKTETWFFQLKFAKCVYIFNWWFFTFVRNLKTLRSSTGLVKSSISNLVENIWSKIP